MKNYLVLGDWNAICDRCGFKHKASQLKKQWNGLMVCSHCYELRHPQEFLRLPKEAVNTAWARPESQDTFVTFHILTQAGDNLLTESGNYLEI